MKNAHYLLISLLLLCSACRHKDQGVTQTLKDGLTGSNRALTDIIDLNYRVLEERMNDPVVHDNATVWTPKIILLRKTANDCIA
ncbi:MAG TPA: hypothetical protein VHD83_27465 [Puia sp.]|nr:hypothetical protein [Puia sp.]